MFQWQSEERTENIMSENLTIPAEEDEFLGLGDDLFKQERKKALSLPPEPTKKELRLKKTPLQKALRVMMKRAGISKIPPDTQIFEGKTGPTFLISEIGFISQDKQSDPLLAELAKTCPVRNRLNRDDISRSQVLIVGAQIFKAGRMWTPIHIHRDIQDGRLECISGRHRLAFLALVYGADLKVPVYLEGLELRAAREATAVANDARSVKALERASYAITRAVGGDVEADQDSLYVKLATLKPNIIKYCVYSVIERGYPSKLHFKMSEKSSRPKGEITTVSNVETFWSEILDWNKETKRQEFDAGLKESVKFLNALVSTAASLKGFDADQHLSAAALTAIARYCRAWKNVTGRSITDIAKDMAQAIVSVGQTSKKQQSEIYGIIVDWVEKNK